MFGSGLFLLRCYFVVGVYVVFGIDVGGGIGFLLFKEGF